MMLAVGDRAPEFTLLSDENSPVSLQHFRGKKVLLYFYPKDNTPGCTKEACAFRDHYSAFLDAETVILGVSKDSVQKHLQFKQKFQLPFLLLADVDGTVCQAYGVLDQKNLFGNTFLGIKRSTFLIDSEGRIAAIWRNVKVNGHEKEVLDVVQR